MYELDIKPEADKIFRKLSKKNPRQLLLIHKKIGEIRSKPAHEYKWLRNPLQGFNRVHIDKNFVLIFKINHDKRTVEIFYYDHHDFVYKWLPGSETF